MDFESSTPLVSIVTPVYNAEKFLARTLDSVLKQTHTHWEQLLVIDQNSSDMSFEIASQYAAKDSRFKILKSENYLGVAKNRNAALNSARGEFIAFLDSDDLWLPTKLEKQVAFMQSQNLNVACHSYQPIDEQDQPIGPLRKAPHNIDFSSLLKDNSMGCLTVMLRKDFLKNRRFPEIKHEDLALWLDLLKDGTQAKALQENLALYRIQSTSLSGNKLKSALWRWKIYRYLEIPFPKSVALLATYAASAIKKRV